MSNYESPPQPPYPPQPQGGSKTWLVVLLVSLSAIGAMVVVCCGGIYYVVNQAKRAGRNFVGDVGRVSAVAAVHGSHFTEEDKDEMIAQIDRVTDEFKAGRLDMGEAGELMMELADSPIFAVSTLRWVEVKHLPRSGLPTEEQQQAVLTLQRTARGVIEEKIEQSALARLDRQYLKELVDPATRAKRTDTGDGDKARTGSSPAAGESGSVEVFKETLTDDQLRGYLAALKKLADVAGIPEEPYQPDVGAEFKKIVDEALAKD